MTTYPITDDETHPHDPKFNNVETFWVSWTTLNGKRHGDHRSTRTRARALAQTVEAKGCTDIQIKRQWIGGWM